MTQRKQLEPNTRPNSHQNTGTTLPIPTFATSWLGSKLFSQFNKPKHFLKPLISVHTPKRKPAREGQGDKSSFSQNSLSSTLYRSQTQRKPINYSPLIIVPDEITENLRSHHRDKTISKPKRYAKYFLFPLNVTPTNSEYPTQQWNKLHWIPNLATKRKLSERLIQNGVKQPTTPDEKPINSPQPPDFMTKKPRQSEPKFFTFEPLRCRASSIDSELKLSHWSKFPAGNITLLTANALHEKLVAEGIKQENRISLP